MSEAPPLICRWSAADNAMHCLSRPGKYFQDGSKYILEVREERSAASHKRSMAWLHDAWLSLPEGLDKRFPSENHLRKWALVRAGFADEEIIPFDSAADAKKAAILVRKKDDYAVIVPKGKVLQIFTAKSQSYRAMDKKTFQESVEAIERVISELLGTTRTELKNAAQ